MERSSRRYVTVEEVYRRYGADLLRFLHGAHPHLNHQDCEDLLHEAVLKAVREIEGWDEERGSLRLWVFGILRNEVRMDLRRRRRKAEPQVPGELPELEAQGPSIEAHAASADELEAVERALGALPWKEREALLSHVRTEGASTVEETASRLGISPGSVAVYRQRARERLRQALGRDQGGERWQATTSDRVTTRP